MHLFIQITKFQLQPEEDGPGGVVGAGPVLPGGPARAPALQEAASRHLARARGHQSLRSSAV